MMMSSPSDAEVIGRSLDEPEAFGLIYDRHAATVLAAAGADSGGSVTLRVPGASASLLETLVGCGFHIGQQAQFLSSRPFGRPELYLPSGPILY